MHEQSAFAVLHRMHLFVKRVPTEVNIAGLPSRLDFALLVVSSAVYVEPVLAESFLVSDRWGLLLDRWK